MIEADQPSSVNVSVLSIKKIEQFNLEERKSIIKSLHNSVQAGSHQNVISLLAVQQQPDKLLVVLDDMFHPDLLAVLRESRAVRFDARVQKQVVSTLSSVHLIDIMLGCAEGCGHLIKQGITHPMLAACNVLVVGRTTVKISGFALANHRLLHQKQFEARPTKQRWQAPEYHVRECADPTCGQSNIWSLGVLIWEIMSLGGTPFAQYSTQEAFLSRIREKRAKLLPLEYCSAELNQLADLCCTFDRDARPDMTDVVIKRLTNIRNGQEDPINLTVDNVEFIYPRILPSLEQIVARL
uniref:Protein kinase domain-containing protein n=1 Tax=Panagrellus redivivus TaxID=6233 RepID=A0A7E4UTB0_PANRE